MSPPSERAVSAPIHATTVAIDGRGVLLIGRSGSGKSDLALRLIDRGAMLVSDDYTQLRGVAGVLYAEPPATIAGKIEVRGLGILPLPHVAGVAVALVVRLGEPVARLPASDESTEIAGIVLRCVDLDAFEGSAPIKVELALRRARETP